MKIAIAATHCYPGCLVRVEDESADPRALIAFGDGTVVLGELTRHDGVGRLSVPGYQTARGTRIEAKLWSLRPEGEPGFWRIKARVATE